MFFSQKKNLFFGALFAQQFIPLLVQELGNGPTRSHREGERDRIFHPFQQALLQNRYKR